MTNNSLNHNPHRNTIIHPNRSSEDVFSSDRRYALNNDHEIDPQINERSKNGEAKHRFPVAILQGDNTDTTETFAPHHHPNVSKRIGYTSMTLLLLAYFAIVSSFIFITWLWFSDHDNPTWRRIVLNSWTTRAVTIAAIVLRTSFTTQGLICTSMLAALALRWREVTLPNAAAVSLLRYTNSGPQSLVLPLLGNRLRVLHMTGLVVLGLLSTTLLVNITSTALLSDLQLRTLPNYSSPMPISYGIDLDGPYEKANLGAGFDYPEGNSKIENYGVLRLTKFPTFAEAQIQPPIAAHGLFDTGVRLRALFPLESTEMRSNLKTYSGRAPLVAMRTVCAKTEPFEPELLQRGLLDFTDDFAPKLDKETQSLFGLDKGRLKNMFEGCTMDLDMIINNNRRSGSPTEWLIRTCSAGYGRSNKTRLLEGLNLKQQTEVFFDRYVVLNFTHVALNTTNKTYTAANPSNEWENGGVVAEYMVGENTPDGFHRYDYYTLNYTASFCTTMSKYLYGTISASRNGNITEPSADFEPSKGSWRNSDILKQLGATRKSHSPAERGIFNLDSFWNITLDPYYQYKEGNMTKLLDEKYGQSGPDLVGVGFGYSSYTFCQNCPDWTFGSSIGALANSAVRETARPGWAMGTLHWTAYVVRYLERLPYFDLDGGDAQVVIMVERLMPVPGWGYWTVCAMVVVHSALVTLVLVLFVLHGGAPNLLGEAWSAVGQLCDGELDVVSEWGACRTDRQVEKELKEKGMNRLPVELVEETGDGQGCRLRIVRMGRDKDG